MCIYTHRYEEKITLKETAALVEGLMDVEIEVGDDEESDDDVSSAYVHVCVNIFVSSSYVHVCVCVYICI